MRATQQAAMPYHLDWANRVDASIRRKAFTLGFYSATATATLAIDAKCMVFLYFRLSLEPFPPSFCS